ncbi:exported protein of unknown function [Agreia sp. COWG]|nr:exported protein of unknown function [Agreia sp. COWG]
MPPSARSTSSSRSTRTTSTTSSTPRSSVSSAGSSSAACAAAAPAPAPPPEPRRAIWAGILLSGVRELTHIALRPHRTDANCSSPVDEEQFASPRGAQRASSVTSTDQPPQIQTQTNSAATAT